MSNLKGSRTEKNLYAAFAGESQAFMKYTLFAEQAKQDGYEKIEQEFTSIAKNEKAHAEMWLKEIHGGNLPKTLMNLQDSANGEHFEWSEMYAEFADVAKEEGFVDIERMYRGIIGVEQGHNNRFNKLISELQNGEIFKSTKVEVWECINCGHYHNAKEAPETCPVCGKPQAFFKKEENKQNN